jgi:hypothetical protein
MEIWQNEWHFISRLGRLTKRECSIIIGRLEVDQIFSSQPANQLRKRKPR